MFVTLKCLPVPEVEYSCITNLNVLFPNKSLPISEYSIRKLLYKCVHTHTHTHTHTHSLSLSSLSLSLSLSLYIYIYIYIYICTCYIHKHVHVCSCVRVRNVHTSINNHIRRHLFSQIGLHLLDWSPLLR